MEKDWRNTELGYDPSINDLGDPVPWQMPVGRAYAPHCDSSILHSPGTCPYCDNYADWQEYRVTARIAFSDQDPPPDGVAPCPSTHFRPPAVRDAWPGNRPEGYTWPEDLSAFGVEHTRTRTPWWKTLHTHWLYR